MFFMFFLLVFSLLCRLQSDSSSYLNILHFIKKNPLARINFSLFLKTIAFRQIGIPFAIPEPFVFSLSFFTVYVYFTIEKTLERRFLF